MTTMPTRPLLRYHGGKWLLAPWIIQHFPPHRTYVEPFCGAASVLLRKPRSYCEVINDLSTQVVTLFQVLRSPAARDLARVVGLTPFSRAEFEAAFAPTDDPVEAARRMIIRSHQGFGASGTLGHSTGWRASSTRCGSTPAQDWAGLPQAIVDVAARLAGVFIDQRPALEVIDRHDRPDTLFYVDPPYVAETRGRGNPYDPKHSYDAEMTDDDHHVLLARLRQCAGMAAVSGYRTALYDEALADWRRVERPSMADGARPRIECLWLSPRLVGALAASHGVQIEMSA